MQIFRKKSLSVKYQILDRFANEVKRKIFINCQNAYVFPIKKLHTVIYDNTPSSQLIFLYKLSTHSSHNA